MTDRAETSVDVADAAEAAAWAELEKEVAPEEGEEQPETEASESEPEAKAEPEKTEAEKGAQQIPYEELDKRYKQLQGALGEERGTRKQLAERLQNMEQVVRAIAAQRAQPQQEAPQQPKIPTLEEDPIGFFKHTIEQQAREIEELRNGTKQTAETFQKTQAERQFWDTVQRSETEFRATNPEYDPAVEFLESARIKEISRMVPETPQGQALAERMGFNTVDEARVSMLNRDRINVARQALMLGISPAQMYYELALERGYQSKPATPQLKKATAQSTPIEAAKKGMQASKSLSGGAGSSGNVMTPEDLAELYLEDPDRADKEFARMKKMGLLG